MNTTWKTRFVAFRSVIILSALLIITCFGGVHLLNWATSPLAEKNRTYLDASIRDTTQLMIPVGVAKAAADMIEGSTIQFEAGIVVTKGGMTVQAGDLMQPMLDCINIAWKILLASAVFLISVKCVVSGFPELMQPFCVAFLACYLVEGLLAFLLNPNHLLRYVLRRIGGVLFLCWILIVAILPLTLAGTAYLAERTTAHMQADIDTTFKHIHEVFNMDGFTTANEMSEKASFLKYKLTEISRFAKDELSTVILAICQLVAVKVISGVFYPLMMLGFLFWLIRGCLYPVMGLRERSAAASDLQKLTGWLAQLSTRSAQQEAAEPKDV
ncbi:MAG: hypothetical protein WCP12_10510 [bacterium]